MLNYLIQWFNSLPPELATMFLAMIPVTELRGSIPIALIVYKLPISSAIFWSIIGDMIPVIFIMISLNWVAERIMKKSKFFNKLLTKIFEQTRNKFSKKYEKYGLVALIIFVGIPLPGTGSWTGSIAAWIFGIPFKKAFPMIALGVLLAAVLVTLISLGIFGSLGFILGY